MEYEIRDIIYTNAPTANDQGDVIQDIVIVTGIIGDKYGFERKDKISVTIPKTKTMGNAQSYVQTEAQKWVDKNYPNI